MSMSKDMWIEEHERAMEAFAMSECKDTEAFHAALRSLGFSFGEVVEQIELAREMY